MCKKVYSREHKLKQHQRLVHGIKIERQCGCCVIPLEWEGEIDKTKQRHQIVFSSTGKASHQCTVCFKLISSCWENYDHQQTHSETDVHATLGFQCKGCLRIMASKMTLQRHISYACPAQNLSHFMAMKYRCQVCFKLFPNKVCWKRHNNPIFQCPKIAAAAPPTSTWTLQQGTWIKRQFSLLLIIIDVLTLMASIAWYFLFVIIEFKVPHVPWNYQSFFIMGCQFPLEQAGILNLLEILNGNCQSIKLDFQEV